MIFDEQAREAAHKRIEALRENLSRLALIDALQAAEDSMRGRGMMTDHNSKEESPGFHRIIGFAYERNPYSLTIIRKDKP